MMHTLRIASPVLTDELRRSWSLPCDNTVVTVRGAVPRDLPGVALLHSRCSAKTLLDRYRSGGRAPGVAILDRQLREPLSYVVITEQGRMVATAQVSPDTDHPVGSAEVAILVEDRWQLLGIGRAVLRHCAAAAALSGYRQLISYPGTTAKPIQRLMLEVGTTRVVTDVDRHLHTSLPPSAQYGLGRAVGSIDRRVG